MIDLILEVFGQMVYDQARAGGKRKPATPVPLKSDARHRALEQDHERLKLITMALWEIVHDRLGVSEEELRRRIEALDLLDERRDGRLRLKRPPRNCVACDRPMLESAATCPYCGERQPAPPLFRV